MNLFDVYPLYDLNISRAKGAWVFDESGRKFLDFYGGHAVISIGHSHPKYVEAIQEQISKIGFYSNSVINPLQSDLATSIGRISGLDEYQLFLINSGAEANENAIKLSSFHNNRSKVISFRHGFHGRTSAAVNVTDNQNIIAPINRGFENIMLEMGDEEALSEALSLGDVSAVIIEGIQGVAGIYEASHSFLQHIRNETEKYNTLMIMDEVQAGYGRSGEFFTFQPSSLKPDLITIAKGMGNGFPIGGVLIHPSIKSKYGMLGTTFGGNHLACVAAKTVLEVIDTEQLIAHAANMGAYLKQELQGINGIKEIRGRGLIIGIELYSPVKPLRAKLLFDHNVFVGSAANPNTLRLLPPLNITKEEVDICLDALRSSIPQD